VIGLWVKIAKSVPEGEFREDDMNDLRSAAADGTPRLMKGIAILGAAAVISKLLGTLQKIPLQNLAGDEAYGIYSAVYPFYVLIMFLAIAGFPVAVSKLVSEQVALGNRHEARRILLVSSLILSVTGLISAAFLYFGAGLVAGWIGASQAEPAIRSVSFALLVVPFMAALRGYYQGLQDMVPTAVSQVAEQTVRVAVMIALIIILTGEGAASGVIAAGATFGSAAGALAGLLVMLTYDVRRQGALRRRRHLGRRNQEAVSGAYELARRIARHAWPVALGSIAVPIINMVDTFTLPNLLVRFHQMSEQEALEQFGVYARGLPLVQLVSMLFSSMSVALVPALSNARALGADDLVKRQTTIALRLTWMIGLAASCGLAVVSLPVNIMLFTDAAGTWTMAFTAWTAVFSALNVVTIAILQGFSLEKLPVVHMFVATAVKIALSVCLIPLFGIAGAAWSGVLAYAAACIMNLRAVAAHANIRISVRNDVLKPILSVIVMSGALAGLYGVFALLGHWFDADTDGRIWNTVQSLVMIVAGAGVFGIAAVSSGALRESDLKLVPGLYRRVAPLLHRWRIMRPARQSSVHGAE